MSLLIVLKNLLPKTSRTTTLAGNVADMSATCRPDMVMSMMSAIFSRKGMSRRHTTRKKRPQHTVFVSDIIQNHPPAHRTCRRRRRRGAAAALLRPLPLPRRLPPMMSCRNLSKKDFLVKTRADNAARATAGVAAAAAAAVAPASATAAAITPYFHDRSRYT